MQPNIMKKKEGWSDKEAEALTNLGLDPSRTWEMVKKYSTMIYEGAVKERKDGVTINMHPFEWPVYFEKDDNLTTNEVVLITFVATMNIEEYRIALELRKLARRAAVSCAAAITGAVSQTGDDLTHDDQFSMGAVIEKVSTVMRIAMSDD